MAKDFTSSSNPRLDREISEAVDPERIREFLKASLVRDGVIEQRDGSYRPIETSAPVVQRQQEPAAGLTCVRVVYPDN